MLDRLVDEIPRFFTYYTILFLLQAMGTTLLMTLIGCVLGFVLGFVIVLLRQTPGLLWAPRARSSRSAMSSSSAASRSWSSSISCCSSSRPSRPTPRCSPSR